MVHYPFIYLYYAWVKNENLTFTGVPARRPGARRGFTRILAYLCLKLYDESLCAGS